MEKQIDRTLDKKINLVNCLKCNNEIFEANLTCNKCNIKYERCIVSGFPIRNNYINCTTCNKKAIDSFWKEWINMFHYCPWCQAIYN